MTTELSIMLENIKTRSELSEFVTALLRDLEKNKDEWENATLSSFLEAISAWVKDMDGYYKNHGKPFTENQSWKTFAEILYAAKMYE